MIVEICKAGFVNKGAELMLYAVLEKMRDCYPHANFAMVPGPSKSATPFFKRAELGFLQKAALWRYGFQWGRFAVLAPQRIRDMYGVVLDKEIDIVIDIAGFSYSDQWGYDSSVELASSCKKWRKNGTKIILMPQAFGPFTSSKIRGAIQTVIDHSDLIFARDLISYEHLIDVTGERDNVKIAPDFTNLVSGMVPETFDFERCRFCLVPNYRMIDKTPNEQRTAYLPFMIRCAQYLQQKKQNPFILIHEGVDDFKLAENIRDATGGDLPIVLESNPLKIKGILGLCQGTISSRFHALVSALSQGVPSLGTGWSHKYKMLFEDYGFSEGLVNVLSPNEKIEKKIDLIIQAESRANISNILDNKSKLIKWRVEEMWKEIFDVIGLG